MPTQKPSPHRFIAPNPSSSQTPKPKPKTNLRHAVPAHTPSQTSGTQSKKITPAKRFVLAPTQRPNAVDTPPRAPDRVEEPSSSTPSLATPRPKAQRKLERVESIEEASQSSPSRPPDDDALDIVQTIEHGPAHTAVEENDYHNTAADTYADEDEDDEILFPSEPRPKRRRTSPLSPTLPSAPPHRFRIPAHPPTPSTNPATTPLPPPSRPHFLPPAQPPSPPHPPKPLPEIFSPTRRAQKYTPDGLASVAQRWILEAAQTGFAAQDRGGLVWGRERDGGVRVRVRVVRIGAEGVGAVECFPGSVVFVRGEVEEGGVVVRAEGLGDEAETGVLLAGQGGARGSGGVRVRVGGVVGIRAPTWNVDVGREKWVVAVDWVVL